MKYLYYILIAAVCGLGGFGIGRATSPNQKAVKAAEKRASGIETRLAESQARAEELARVTAELTLCNARPTTNTGKIKNNVRVK